MRTVLVTGSASGLGAALAGGLRDRGHRVIGLDVREADIIADLGNANGRESAIAGVLDLCGGTLDGVVSCAGLGPYEQPEPIISVNYFGAIAMLDRFRDALARGDAPAAVAISSVGAAFHQIVPDGVLEACHAGDEKRARELLATTNGNTAYVSAKRALAQAARRRAGEWGERGIRLNTVAPGKMETPDARRAARRRGQRTCYSRDASPAGSLGTGRRNCQRRHLPVRPRCELCARPNAVRRRWIRSGGPAGRDLIVQPEKLSSPNGAVEFRAVRRPSLRTSR